MTNDKRARARAWIDAAIAGGYEPRMLHGFRDGKEEWALYCGLSCGPYAGPLPQDVWNEVRDLLREAGRVHEFFVESIERIAPPPGGWR
jgi:hypothetical protein